MKLDTRNPFAAWGFEQEVYGVNVPETDDSGIVELEEKGFINETVVDEAYNEVATPISGEAFANSVKGEAFFTNNEVMLPTELKTKAYGDDQQLQREYPAGESLNYYGNEADDLKLYGDAEESNEETTPEPEPEPNPEP